VVAALVRVVRLVLVVLGVRFVLGAWPAAVVVAAGGLWWGLRAWHRWESGPGRPRVLVPEIVTHRRRPRPNPGHVDFARALAAVTAEYLARCEQEAEL
jgi:hypothetical protein